DKAATRRRTPKVALVAWWLLFENPRVAKVPQHRRPVGESLGSEVDQRSFESLLTLPAGAIVDQVVPLEQPHMRRQDQPLDQVVVELLLDPEPLLGVAVRIAR